MRLRVAAAFVLLLVPAGCGAEDPGSDVSSGPRTFRDADFGYSFDPDRFEFTCPELGARWSRVGEVLEKPAGRPEDALLLHATKVSWDGHVLVSTNEGSFGGGHVEDELWPEGR